MSAATESADLVLAVEDEPAVCELIAGILVRGGYRVLTAGSSEEAIEAVRERDEIAAVLTDINMPGEISGLELIDELRGLRPSLPIVLVSGLGAEAHLREALDRGAAGFVSKPFTARELREKVAAAIDRVSLVAGELRERLLAPTVATVLANAIEVRQVGMVGHTERLASLALEIGRLQGLAEPELEVLELGAVLHDIGKIGIPDSILMKPGPLTADERAVMERHAEIGDRMLEPLELLGAVRPIVRHHHERWDGTGYPDRLGGDEIPLPARIVALADSIEAMSGERVYRAPFGRDAVVRELESGAGGQWEPRLAELALDLISAGRLRFGVPGMTVLAAA